MVPALVQLLSLRTTRIELKDIPIHTFRVVLRSAHTVTVLADLAASAFVADLTNDAT